MTLVEILVVVGLVGIMIVMATVSFDYVRGHQLTSASRELMGDLQSIRQNALTQGGGANSRGYGIRFAGPTSYVTFEFVETGAANFVYDDATEESNIRTKTLSGSITVANSVNGDPTGETLIYDRRGIPRTTAWVTAPQTIYVLSLPTNVATPRCVLMDQVRIREGKWDGANCVVS